jgi:hypothetical protein
MPIMCEECKCSNWICPTCGESNANDCDCSCCGCDCQKPDSGQGDSDAGFKILSAESVALAYEDSVIIEHEGVAYKWVGFFSENSSDSFWYLGDQLIPCPEWAEDLDMDSLGYEFRKGVKE